MNTANFKACDIFRILPLSVISRKMDEGLVNKTRRKNFSKECACPTCTPCKGLRPVDPAPTAHIQKEVLP
jgi:hypothetical protein